MKKILFLLIASLSLHLYPSSTWSFPSLFNPVHNWWNNQSTHKKIIFSGSTAGIFATPWLYKYLQKSKKNIQINEPINESTTTHLNETKTTQQTSKPRTTPALNVPLITALIQKPKLNLQACRQIRDMYAHIHARHTLFTKYLLKNEPEYPQKTLVDILPITQDSNNNAFPDTTYAEPQIVPSEDIPDNPLAQARLDNHLEDSDHSPNSGKKLLDLAKPTSSDALNSSDLNDFHIVQADSKLPVLLNYHYVQPLLEKSIAGNKSLNIDQVADFIVKGGSYMYHLTHNNNQAVPQADLSEHLNSILAINWYLYSEGLQALYTKQPYTEGAFTVVDKKKALTNFVRNYLKYGKSFAYTRKSSHKGAGPVGIDIRFTDTGYCLPLLPMNKKHLLIQGLLNKSGEDILFLKPENEGLRDTIASIKHAGEWAFSTITKFFGTAYDDKAEFAKERVPTDIQNRFTHLVKNCHLYPEQKEEFKNDAEKFGLAGIYNSLKIIAEDSEHILDDNSATTAKDLIKDIEQQYNHLDVRHGREMVITPSELHSTLYYATIDDKDIRELLEPIYLLKNKLSQALKDPENKELTSEIFKQAEQLKNNKNAYAKLERGPLKAYCKTLLFGLEQSNTSNDIKKLSSLFLEHTPLQFVLLDGALQERKMSDPKKTISEEVIEQFGSFAKQAQDKLDRFIDVNKLDKKVLNELLQKNQRCSSDEMKAKIDKQFDHEKNTFNDVFNESTGIRKTTEFRSLTGGDNFDAVQIPTKRLYLKYFTCLEYLTQQNKTVALEDFMAICLTLKGQAAAVRENIIIEAEKHGFLSNQHLLIQPFFNDCKNRLALVLKYAPEQYPQANKENLQHEITVAKDQFDNYLAFAENSGMLQENLKSLYRTTKRKYPLWEKIKDLPEDDEKLAGVSPQVFLKDAR